MGDDTHLQRVIRAYLVESGRSRRDLSLEATDKRNDSLVKQILSGQSANPRRDTLARLAKAMGKQVTDLLEPGDSSSTIPISADTPPFDVQAMPRDVEVRGIAVGGNSGDFTFNGEVIDYVRRPPGITAVKHVAALYYVGASMYPWRQQGDLLYFTDQRPARDGDHVIVEMHPKRPGEPGPAYVKKLGSRSATKLRLEQYNPPDDHIELKLADVLRIYRVYEWPELLGIA